jgi:hypothetical protein
MDSCIVMQENSTPKQAFWPAMIRIAPRVGVLTTQAILTPAADRPAWVYKTPAARMVLMSWVGHMTSGS